MRYLFSLFALLISLSGYSQQRRSLDSMVMGLASMPDDTPKVEELSVIAMRYVGKGKNDSALLYADQGLTLAKRLNWKTGELDAYNNIGNIYESLADYPAALDAYFKALHINDSLGLIEGVAILSGNISNIYLHQKNYPEALKYSLQFLRAAERLKDQTGLFMANGSVGNVYTEQGNFKEGLHYQERALAAAEALGDSGSIAVVRTNMSVSNIKLKQYGQALSNAFIALRLAKAGGHTEVMASAMANIGEAYLRIAQDNAAIPDSLVPASKQIALQKAIDYMEQSLVLSRQLKNYPFLMEGAQTLAEAYVQKGDYKAALGAYQEFAAAKDTIFNTENSTQIHRLETRRALELKDKDIQIAKLEVAKKRNERWAFITGIGLLLVIVAALLRNYRKQRQSNLLLAKEKDRSEDLLRNILPDEVAEELKSSGAAQARHFDDVSVLFTDFVNFTGRAEQLGPQELVKELHECFSAFDAIIERAGLEKIKTVGDAYIAVCGLPLKDARHAQKTVMAALEIRDFIEKRVANASGDIGAAFQVRIGIHSGPVVAGIVGVKKFAYDIWGDAVNTAARMEQHGEPGRINISQNTYGLIKDEFICTQRGKIAAKNKGEIEMYFVDAPRTGTLMPERNGEPIAS